MALKYHDYAGLKDRCERLSRRMIERARKLSVEAGTGEQIGTRLHNALVSRSYGKPWRGVDYHKARKAQWIINRSSRPNRLLDALYERGRVAVNGKLIVRGKGLVPVETY